MSRAAETLKRAGPYAPAFFLVLAVAFGGLRAPGAWLLFGAAFLPWAALTLRGFSTAGAPAPLLFFSWLAAAAVFSPEPAVSLGVFSRYAVLGLLFFCAASSEEGGAGWLAAVTGLGAASAAVFILQRLAGHGPTGLIGLNPNYSAAFCAAAFPAAVLALSGDPGSPDRGRLATARMAAVPALSGAAAKKERLLYSALALLLAAGIFASVSRGAALAAFLSAAAGLVFTRRWKYLAGLLAAGLAAAALLPASSLENLVKLTDPRAFARPRLWGAALEAAASSPLLGRGPGSFGKSFEVFKFPYFDGLSYYGHGTLNAHSEVLNLAAEAGFPAALLFLLAAAAVLVPGGKEKLPLRLCALSALLQGAADMIFYSGAVALLFWGSLGFSAKGGPAVPAGGRSVTLLAALCFFGLALGAAVGLSGGRKEFPGAAGPRPASDPAPALALARSAALDAPKDPFRAAEEGLAAAAAGDAAGAEAAFDRALALEPAFAGARLDLALVRAAAGRGGEACAELAMLGKARPAGELNPYQRALVRFDRRAAEELEKELCGKKKTGAATAPPRRKR